MGKAMAFKQQKKAQQKKAVKRSEFIITSLCAVHHRFRVGSRSGLSFKRNFEQLNFPDTWIIYPSLIICLFQTCVLFQK